MTNVSKRTLNPKAEEKLFRQFTRALSRTSDQTLGALLGGLFSPTEKIMFIKRFAVILLLLERCSAYRIARTLHVSETTVNAIRKQLEEGRYAIIERMHAKKSFAQKDFWQILERLLMAGLPPRGRGRWKWLYDMK